MTEPPSAYRPGQPFTTFFEGRPTAPLASLRIRREVTCLRSHSAIAGAGGSE